MKRLCNCFSNPSLYRESIYKKMDDTFDCDWYFGDNPHDVKLFDTNTLKRVGFLHVSNAGHRIFCTFGLLRLLFDKRYDDYFMYLSTWDLCAWIFLLLKRFFFHSKRVSLWCHGWYGKESYWEAKLKRFMYDSVDRIFCYGDYARNLLVNMGYSGDKVCAIHNSLDYDRQLAIRSKLQTSDIYKQYFKNDNPVLIFIGRQTKVKRLDLLLEALYLLREQGHSYNLILVGDGTEQRMLRKITEEKKMESNVWFFGACFDEQTNAELIYNADLCVAPGNVGLTAMHTMVFGTPVVTHDSFEYQMPEFEAIKAGVTGAFFKYNDVNSMAETIVEWFSLHKEDRNQVRESCYQEIAENWTPDFQLKVIKENLMKY